MQYVIFNPKLPGEILDPVIAENIIAAAKRGHITKAAESLMLVPDKRKEYRDKNNLRYKGYGSVKRSECIPLKSLAFGK